ncbi:molecular chaperone [Pseudomonas matsuisoli]|nr:molecular chaperone [Pseudomonas matsuisoli]
MEQSAPYLRIAAPDRLTLSACATDVAAFSEWLGALPRHQLGIVAQQLSTMLLELNRLHATPALLLQLLDRLRTDVQTTCHQLDGKVAQTSMQDERTRKVVTLCQALQTQLAAGYKRVALECLRGLDRDDALATQALQRALSTLGGPLLRTARRYCHAPTGLWLEAHQLHGLARQHALHSTPAPDDLIAVGHQSIDEAYLALLLFGSARTNQLRPYAIEIVYTWLRDNSSRAYLTPANHSECRFIVAAGEDTAPRDKQSISLDSDAKLGIVTTSLIASLSSDTDTSAKRLGADVTAHLQRTWTQCARRRFNRTPGQGTLRVCVGMAAVHTLFADGESFAAQLKSTARDRTARFRLNNDADVWAEALTGEAPTDWLGMPSEKVEFRVTAEEATPEKIEHFEPEILDHGPGGYCLRWPDDTPAVPLSGEILAVQDLQHRWTLAVVRWISRHRLDTRMGIQLIAPNAQPCGLRLIQKIGEQTEYVRALLIPENALLSRPAMIITPRLPFQEQSKVSVNLRGEERRALLIEQHDATASFSQFTFRWLAAMGEITDDTGLSLAPRTPSSSAPSIWTR